MPSDSLTFRASCVATTSPHYRLVAAPTFGAAAELVALAEELLVLLQVHFARPVPADVLPFEVRFFEDAAQFALALEADAIPAQGSGGVYWTSTRCAYFFAQPSQVFTRHLFLHELTHQFHFETVMALQYRAPGWYVEGIAEHFAYHKWHASAARLCVGEHDVVALEQDIPQLVARCKDGSFSLSRVLQERCDEGRVGGYAACAYLSRGAPDGVRDLWLAHVEPALSQGVVGKDTILDELFGTAARGAEAAIDAACRAWLIRQWRSTWRIVWVSWDERATADGSFHLVSHAAPHCCSLVVTHAACSQLEATLVHVPGQPLPVSGWVFGFVSADDWWAVRRVLDRDLLVLQHRHHDVWDDILYVPCTVSRLCVALDAATRRLLVTCNQLGLVLIDRCLDACIPGPMGFFSMGGPGEFAGIRIA